MKKTIIILLSLISAGNFSCNKFLEVSPQSAFDQDYVFDSVQGATSAVFGIYNQLCGDWAYGGRLNFFYTVDTDETLGSVNTASGGGDNGAKSLARYNATAGNTQLENPYNQLYTGIERANICIKSIPEMNLYKNGTDSDKKQLGRLYGEALTLRAQFYFELIRNWGDIPARFEPSATQTDFLLERTDRDVIYDRILEDLKLAEAIVPWRKDPGIATDERITKGAVKALRAKIALFRGGYSLRRESGIMERRSDYLKYYEIARDECKDIITSQQHDLNPSFSSVFKDYIDAHKIEPNGEVIFEVAMAGGTGYTDGRSGYTDGPRYGSTGGGNMLILPTYFYSFDSLDVRRDVTAAPYITDLNNNKIGQEIINITSGKFRRDWHTPAVPLTSTLLYYGINWPLIRYSDVLLMFAEAENELNPVPTPDAKDALEKVRKRAFAGNVDKIGVTPTEKTDFFNAIVKERLHEFGGEGIRKFDLIRWNLLETKILETRANLRKIISRAAPYNTVPLFMYYKAASPTLIWANSFYKASATTAPAGYVQVKWGPYIKEAYVVAVAELFKANHSELLPLPQAAINSNIKLK